MRNYILYSSLHLFRVCSISLYVITNKIKYIFIFKIFFFIKKNNKHRNCRHCKWFKHKWIFVYMNGCIFMTERNSTYFYDIIYDDMIEKQ